MISVYPHPGYLYEFRRREDTLVPGSKQKEQTLYTYLIPPKSSSIDPFNNRRLKSILTGVEVIVFDSPPQEKNHLLFNIRERLQKNYSNESLLKINNRLTESLKSDGVDMIPIEKLIREGAKRLAAAIYPLTESLNSKTGDKDQNMVLTELAAAVSLKIAIFMIKNADCETDTLVSPGDGPKHKIFQAAKEGGKAIEFVDSKDRAFRLNESVFEMIDSEFMEISEKAPKFSDLREKLRKRDELDDMFTLCKKINSCLSSHKKTLLILEKTPRELKQLEPIISYTAGYYSIVTLKGPIKEPTGCFWKIKKNGKTVGGIMGSLHFAPNYLLDLNYRIRKFFNESNWLAVEIDITREDIVRANILNLNKFWAEKYKTLTNEQIWGLSNILQKLFPKMAERIDFNNKEQEWRFIVRGILRLEQRVWNEHEIYSGMDLRLIQEAKKIKMPVKDLETLKQYKKQVTTRKMLEGDPEIDLILRVLLSKSLQDLEDADQVLKVFMEQVSLTYWSLLRPAYDAWEEGNLEVFDCSKTDPIEKTVDMRKRNENIAKKIFSLINEKEGLFCCVGAGHTVGELSVQDFLKGFGFSIERVLN